MKRVPSENHYCRNSAIPHPTYRIFSDTLRISLDSPSPLPVQVVQRSRCHTQIRLRGISRLRACNVSSFDLAVSGIVIA